MLLPQIGPFFLSIHFQQRREAMRLGRRRISSLVGFRNMSRGARCIEGFEERGIVHVDLLKKLMHTLDVDEQTLEELLEEDRREGFRRWSRWANEPIRPYVWQPGLMPINTAVPSEHTDLMAAEVFAADLARKMRSPVRLIWSRRLTVEIDEVGRVLDWCELCGVAWPFVPLIEGQ